MEIRLFLKAEIPIPAHEKHFCHFMEIKFSSLVLFVLKEVPSVWLLGITVCRLCHNLHSEFHFCTATATKTFRSHKIYSGLWSSRKTDKVQIIHLEYNHWCVSNSGYWTVGIVWMWEKWVSQSLRVSWMCCIFIWKSAKLVQGAPLGHSWLNLEFSWLWAFQHMLVSTRRVSLTDLFPPDRHIFVNDYS